MPPVLTPAEQWLAAQLTDLKQAVAALKTATTTFVVDPTIANASAGNPNCKAIIGNIAYDNFGNPTGLSGWGIASHRTGSWIQL